MILWSKERYCDGSTYMGSYYIHYTQSLLTVLKKRVTVDKDHVKNIQKMVQTIHDDGQTKHMKFQG